MKKTKTYVTILIITLFVLISCSKDDSTPITEEPLILGKWELYEYDVKLYVDGKPAGDSENVSSKGIEYHFKTNDIVDYRFFNPETNEDNKVGTGSYEQNEENELIMIRESKPYSFKIELLNKDYLYLFSIEKGYDTQGKYIELETINKFRKLN